MKKLGSVETMEEFVLAIAGGADVNGTWKGRPLVEHYFTESMRHIVVYPTEHPKSNADINMLKLQAIISAGANVSPLFRSENVSPSFRSEYEYYEYGNLVRLISLRLDLLKVVLSSGQAKEIVVGNKVYLKDLSELYERLQSMAETIVKMDIFD